ncbi:class I SAM-dependent methyltransferase [Nonlabens marinus]|uniref:Uncharacterized protein n=1 Tax=Nonlabens marinus S1-08 TaxID=1454201 RepID=W8VRP4_9FLAO|nr:class I SAM-dependent methyltransferase [Nonlabens marinus]BAO55730.1 hypothetical protein NMS_1721 [Nonlabens marinus S1-08]
MNSPISHKEALKIDSFKAQQIIKLYEDQIKLDVSRHFKGIENIDLYECAQTGYRFYYPFSTIGDAQFYKDLAHVRSNYYSTRWEHKQIAARIDREESVLEIGSGYGIFLTLLKERGVHDVTGIELSAHAAQHCSDKGLPVFQQTVEQVAGKNKLYDVVCAFQVLEHITDVHSFLSACLAVLHPGGRLILGVPNNNPFLFKNDKYHTLNLPPHHAGLWSGDSLKALSDILDMTAVSLSYEPLSYCMQAYISSQITNSRNPLRKSIFISGQKVLGRHFGKLVNKVEKGRNVLAVFKKVDHG